MAPMFYAFMKHCRILPECVEVANKDLNGAHSLQTCLLIYLELTKT